MTNPFGLVDPDFWESPFRTLPDFAWDRIGAGVSGVVLGCPSRVDIGARRTLPMLAYYSASLRERARTPFDRAVVVAVEQEHGVVLAAVVEPREAPPEEGDPGEGRSGSEHLVDLRDRLALPWSPGTWRAQILLREQRSNAALVRLERGGHVYADEAVDRFRAAESAAARWAALTARSGDPVVTVGGAPAPIAEDVGFALEGDRVVARRPGAAARVVVSFRLPVTPSDIDRTSGQPPRAAPPIHLILIGSVEPSPIIVPVRAPTADISEQEVGPAIASGRVEVDLLRVASLPSEGQTYVVWAVARGAISDPLPIAIVPARTEGG